MEQLKILIVIGLISGKTLATIDDYPPKGDFSSNSNLIWGPPINSRAQLDSSLQNRSIQMMEADVGMGKLTGNRSSTHAYKSIPVLAHHPSTDESDIHLIEFLLDIISHNRGLGLTERKGIKLDFRDQRALHMGLNFLEIFHGKDPTQLEFPIWIHVNILPGPVNAPCTVKVDGRMLARLQNLELPSVTLSLGWTTRFLPGGSYSKEHLTHMINLLNISDRNWTCPITFPLRAQLALKAVNDIKGFLDDPRIEAMLPSVTLWEDSLDPRVTREELKEFIGKIGKDRVFLNLPHGLVNRDRVQEAKVVVERGTGVRETMVYKSLIIYFLLFLYFLK